MTEERRRALRLAGVTTIAAVVVIALTTTAFSYTAGVPQHFIILQAILLTAALLMAGGALFIFMTRVFQRQSLTEDSLRRSEERFRQAITHFPYGVTIYDADLKIRFVNAFARRLYDTEYDNIIGKEDALLLPEADYAQIGPELKKVAASGKAHSVECEFERGSHRLTNLFTFAPTFNPDGSLREIVSVQVDMTAFKAMGQHVRQSDRSLKTLISINQALAVRESEEALLLGFCTSLVEHGGFRSAVAGFEAGEHLFQPRTAAWGWVHQINQQTYQPEQWSEEALCPCAAFQTGELTISEVDCGAGEFRQWESAHPQAGNLTRLCLPIHVDGKVHCVLRLVCEADSRVVDRETLAELAAAIAFGIEAVRNHQELREERARLEEQIQAVTRLDIEAEQARSRLDFATKAAGVGTFDWDVTGNRLTWNDFSAGLFGAPPNQDEAHLTADMWLDAIPEGDRNHVIKALTERDAGPVTSLTYQITRPDGERRFIRTTGRIMDPESGASLRVAGVHQDITREHEQSALLQQQQELVEHVFDASPTGILLLETMRDEAGNLLDFRLRLVNSTAEKILHRTLTAGQDSELGTLLPEFHDSGLFERFVGVIESGEAIEYEHLNPVEMDRWLQTTATPHGDGLLITILDITDRKNAESITAENEQRFRAVIESSPDGIILCDLDGLVIDCNPRTCEMFGYTEDEIRTKTVFDLDQAARKAGDQAARDFWRDLAASGDTATIEGLHVRKDGSTYPAEVRATSLMHRGKQAIIGFIRDVTERRRREEQLRLQQSALEAAASPVVITDIDANIVWVNPAFTKASGYAPEEVTGKNPRILKSGRHDKAFYEDLWKTLTAGKTWKGSFINRRKDDSEFHEEAVITPVPDERGRITHYIAIKQDVTEKRELEEQFRRAQRMESIGLLAGGIAHDLNNVLAPILMAVEMLRLDAPKEQTDEVLKSLEDSVHRGANIIRQVLTFARGGEGKHALLQVRHLLKEIVKIAQETFPRNIVITSNFQSTLWPVVGDPTQIHQVLLNLSVNARDAMAEGGQLSFEARNEDLSETRSFLNLSISPGPFIRISVKDTGSGMSAKTAEKIFDPFFTTKDQGKGTGLGLPTALGIIKGHKGLIELETQPGKGSCFTVWLPARPHDKKESDSEPNEPPPRGNGERILVVDDEPEILRLTSRALTSGGYQVETAADGATAIAMIANAKSTYAAVLTDIMMPFMDGIALARAIRKIHPAMPILVCTGITDADATRDRTDELKSLGITSILSKPFDIRTLLVSLRENLDR